jgi:hypothetical protein
MVSTYWYVCPSIPLAHHDLTTQLGPAFTSTVLTAHHALLDILSSSTKDDIYQTLRSKAESTLDNPAKWSNLTVRHLHIENDGSVHCHTLRH